MPSPRSLASALAALALTGCYAQIEDQSVSITKACDGGSDCTFSGIPTALQELIPISLASGSTDVAIDLGDQDFLKPEKELGPLTLRSNLGVDQVVVQSHGGVPLDGIQSLRVTQVSSVGCTGLCGDTVVATYERPTNGPPDPTRLVLQGNPNVNLLQFGTKLAIRLEASGRLPDVNWSADLTVEGHLEARADWGN